MNLEYITCVLCVGGSNRIMKLSTENNSEHSTLEMLRKKIHSDPSYQELDMENIIFQVRNTFLEELNNI